MEHINSSGTALKAPPDLVRRVLEDIDIETDPKPPRPGWVPLMCLNRVFFSGCIIKVQEPGCAEERIYKFVFGMQSLHLVCLAPLVVSDAPPPAVAEVGYAAALRDSFDHVFTLACNSYAYSDDGVWSAESSVSVMTNASHLWGNVVVADGVWQSWEVVSAWFAPAPAEASAADPADENKDDPAWDLMSSQCTLGWQSGLSLATATSIPVAVVAP